MDDPKEEFGPIRVLGTGGWIVGGTANRLPTFGSFGYTHSTCRDSVYVDGRLLLDPPSYAAPFKDYCLDRGQDLSDRSNLSS
jgi:hypothetical protein